VLAVGVAVIIAHVVLSAFAVDGIGAPTDIGGGMIKFVGVITTAMGIWLLGEDVQRHRRARRSTGIPGRYT
jgi:hypothetical protein